MLSWLLTSAPETRGRVLATSESWTALRTAPGRAWRAVHFLHGVNVTTCAFGPCDRSKERGGEGCHLCDVVAHLPQPARRGLAELQPLQESKARRVAAAPVKMRSKPTTGNVSAKAKANQRQWWAGHE